MKPRYVIFGIGIIIIFAIAWAALFAWRSPPILETPEELETVLSPRTPTPGSSKGFHIYKLQGNKGAALVFGTRHTNDPNDPMLIKIDEAWVEFDPTVALVEGRLGFLLPGLMDPVINFGEMGHVARLAKRSGVRLASWEPGRNAEVAVVVRAAGRERAAVYFILRPLLSSRRFGPHKDPDGQARDLIKERGTWEDIDGAVASVADLDRIWNQYVPDGPDWRDASDEFGWPEGFKPAVLAAGFVRDDHLMRLVLDQIRRGERAFVAAGMGHALKLEMALKRTLAERAGKEGP